jgi:hypothetical protein
LINQHFDFSPEVLKDRIPAKNDDPWQIRGSSPVTEANFASGMGFFMDPPPEALGIKRLATRLTHINIRSVQVASVENRSKYVAAAEGEPELSQQFPYYALGASQARLRELRKQGKHAQLTQGQDTLLIRLRDKGYPKHDVPAASYEEADRIIKQVAADRAAGRRRIDYHRAYRVTFAELFDRYMIEVCPLHKGCEVEQRVFNSFLLDIGYESHYERKRRAARIAGGRHADAHRRSVQRTNIEWLEKPFSDVGPEDLQRYAQARIAQGIRPATVDKELDLMSQVVAWAQDTKNYDLEKSPFKGLRRPRYHNERDRRLEGDELERLLAAAREEDRLHSLKLPFASVAHRRAAAVHDRGD